jgi:hypothetical protein
VLASPIARIQSCVHAQARVRQVLQRCCESSEADELWA